MTYVCAATEARARNYMKTRYVSATVVINPEDVPEFERGDTIVVVGTLPAPLRKAVWDAWRDVDGITKRWVS